MKTSLAFLLSISLIGSAQAGSVGTVNAASETTQYLNYGELYSQTNTVMSQLQTQISQLDTLRQQVEAGGAINDFASSKKLFGDVVNTVKQAQGIGYDSTVMAGRFSGLYPDFNARTGTNFFSDYGRWSQDLNGLLKAAMGTSNLHVQNFANDAETNRTLQAKVATANTSQSQIAVATAATEVAVGTYQEMQQLRQMQAVQNSAMVSYMAKQTAETDARTADAQRLTVDTSNRSACLKTKTCTIQQLVQETKTENQSK